MSRALLLLALAGVVAAQDDKEFKYSKWAAWNGFAVGSSVTVELSSTEVKFNTIFTLSKKEAEQLVLETATEAEGTKEKNDPEQVDKEDAAAVQEKDQVDCLLCKKHKTLAYKNGAEKRKIGDKEYDTLWFQNDTLTCGSKVVMTSKTWYCKDVPGWIVRRETTVVGAATFTENCVAFVKK